MPVEFDEFSSDSQSEEPLENPGSTGLTRRRWVIAACAGGVVVALGAGIALAQGAASASGQAAAPAGSSSSAPASGASNRPTDHRPAPRGPGGMGGIGAGKPVLFGTVKSVAGATLLITDFQGFTRTIVTSSKTVYQGGLTAASLKAGVKILAAGTVDANGTSLDATLISAFTMAGGGPGGAGRGYGGPGYGGPGGHPSGTGVPTARPSGFGSDHHQGHPGGTKAPTPTATPTTTA